MLFRSNDTATTEIYTVEHTLSLHDALPIFRLQAPSLALDIDTPEDVRRAMAAGLLDREA